jgi:hypothetical protein
MGEMKYIKLTEVLGRWRAEIVETFLESEGIDVELIQDSLSQSTYISPFSLVEIFVPKEHLAQARQLVKDLEGVLQENDNDEEADDEEE